MKFYVNSELRSIEISVYHFIKEKNQHEMAQIN